MNATAPKLDGPRCFCRDCLADLDFGAATRDGPCAYIVDASNITLTSLTLRGRRNVDVDRLTTLRH